MKYSTQRVVESKFYFVAVDEKINDSDQNYWMTWPDWILFSFPVMQRGES